MKNEIVLVPFPFDDLTRTKTRPALCLTDVISPHQQIVIAFITSASIPDPAATDLIIEIGDIDFGQTGLKVSSTVRLHRLTTVSKKLVKRRLGSLSDSYQERASDCLRELFKL